MLTLLENPRVPQPAIRRTARDLEQVRARLHAELSAAERGHIRGKFRTTHDTLTVRRLRADSTTADKNLGGPMGLSSQGHRAYVEIGGPSRGRLTRFAERDI
jgi:hypothetical protein